MSGPDRNAENATPIGSGAPSAWSATQIWARIRKLPKTIIIMLVIFSVTVSAGLTGLFWFAVRGSGYDFAKMQIGAAANTTQSKPNELPKVSAGQQLFYWKNNSDDRFRATVDAAPYQKFASQQIEQISVLQSVSIKTAYAQVRADLQPMLTSIERRVSAYGDWMYNWWTAWILLAQALGWAWQGLIDGNILSLPSVLQTRLVVEIRDKYNEIVLRPELLKPQMQAILDRSIAGVQRDILEICGRHDDDLRAFVRNETSRGERYDRTTERWDAVSLGDVESRRTMSVASICQSVSLENGRGLVDELLAEKPMGDLDGGVNEVILRLSRPFATKLISFIALPLTATAIAGGIALPFVGLAGGIFAGVLAGGAVGALIIGFSTSAAVDWLLTRADEAISRENFEGNLRRAVNVAATRFEERVSVALQKHVTAQYAQVTSTILGHKP